MSPRFNIGNMEPLLIHVAIAMPAARCAAQPLARLQWPPLVLLYNGALGLRRPDLFGRTMRRTRRHSEQGHPLLGGWKPRAELTKPRPGAPRPAKAGCRPSQQLGRLPACVATTPPDPQRDLFLNRKQVRSQVKNDADVF
jgi:hypothetical protein